MVELNTYERYLLLASQGNPIKLAVLLNQDLHKNHPDAFTLVSKNGHENVSIDNILTIAEQIVNTKTV